MTGADPASLDLGWVKRDDLPPALADAAFALKQDGVSAPVGDGTVEGDDGSAVVDQLADLRGAGIGG